MIIPTLSFGGASVGITYTKQLFEYALVTDAVNGSRVLFFMNLVLKTKGTSIGAAMISLDPGHPAPPLGTEQFVARSKFIKINQPGSYYLGLYAAITDAGFALRKWGDDCDSMALTDADFRDTSQINFGGSYRI